MATYARGDAMPAGPSRRPTLADVAKLAGLSTSAASMILNGRPDTRLSADAHRRVLESASKLGYRPNVTARSLKTSKTQTIGFISDLVATTRFASGLIRGALEAAEDAGHVLLVLETRGEPERETEALGTVLDRQVDGIIFATMRARELAVPKLPKSTKVVMLNALNERYPISVSPDEENGGRAAVRMLAQAGHFEGIALIGQNEKVEKGLFRSTTIARRVFGIRDEMLKRNLVFSEEISSWLWEPEEGYKATMKLFKSNDSTKALICMNDRLAFGAYQALQELGYGIPSDVSIVSFDNDEVASYLRPGLTTIGLPHEEMGRKAVDLLLEGAAKGEYLVPMPIFQRESIRRA